MKKISSFLISLSLIVSNNYACAQEDQLIEIIQNGVRYNTTIHDFCSQYEESGYSFLDKTTMGSNITFISLNCVLIGGAAFTLGTAIHRYRRSLINYWDNLNTSSEIMEIAEILPPTMPQVYIEHLQTIDDILSADLSAPSTRNAKGWLKFPIYGVFKKKENSWFDHLTCYQFKRGMKEYLYGYLYKNGDYSVEISCHFDIRRPEEVNTGNLYKINTIFKNYTKGIKKNPSFSPRYDLNEHTSSDLENGGYVPAHPYLNLESCSNVHLPDVQSFLESFIKERNFSQSHFPLGIRDDNPFTALLTLLETDDRVKFSLSGDKYNNRDKKPNTHLYFLFPTYPENKKDKEAYSIILHIMQRGKEYLTYEGIIPRGPLYLDTEEESDSLHFTLAKTKGDGDCGFSAIGTTREKSLKLLKGAKSNPFIRNLVAPEIFRALKDETLPETLKPTFKEINDQYQRLINEETRLARLYSSELGCEEGAVKNLDELLNDDNLSKKNRKTIVKLKRQFEDISRKILALAGSEDIYLKYIKSFKTSGVDGSGWLTHTPNESMERPIGTNGLYDAIAYLHGINLYIWQVPENETQAKLIHWHEDEKNYSYAHVLHNGRDHYDTLKCHEKIQRGEELVINPESSQLQPIKNEIRQRKVKGKEER